MTTKIKAQDIQHLSDDYGYPKWWFRNGLLSKLLLPLSLPYGWLVRLQSDLFSQRVLAPVVCVGSVNMGGTGKSPMARVIAREAQMQGYKVAVISRGYGGRVRGVAVVEATKSSVEEVGDEALNHAGEFLTYVAPRRIDAAQAAIKNGASFIVMDDGMQHRSLYKDVSILMLGNKNALGNQQTIPSGPLRESLAKIWKRTDYCLFEDDGEDVIPENWQGKRVKVEPVIAKKADKENLWLTKPVLAFCGIARPHRFFAGLAALGCDIRELVFFRDHQKFSPAILTKLSDLAQSSALEMVTTEKDWVRLPKAFQHKVTAISYQLRIRPYSAVTEIVKLAKLRHLVRDPVAFRKWLEEEQMLEKSSNKKAAKKGKGR